MSWRDRLAKLIAGKPNTGLTMDVFHGTKAPEFSAFADFPVKDAYTIDRALGTHVARDPALSGSFAAMPGDYPKWQLETYERLGRQPRVMPLKAPPDEAFLPVHQPRYPNQSFAGGSMFPEWQKVLTDTLAVEHAASKEAFRLDPDLLKHHLETSRRMPAGEAYDSSRRLLEGRVVPIDNKPHDLDRLLSNYGAPIGDDAKQRVVDLARGSWQDKGYAGLKYINTAPMEAGAPGVKDPTSYIVFKPSDLRSRFAAFDPANVDLKNLLYGVAGAGVVPGAIAAQNSYEAEP